MFQTSDKIFAVAGSVMWLPQGTAFADGVTILPPGTQWLWKSLLCTGAFVLDDLPKHVNIGDPQVCTFILTESLKYGGRGVYPGGPLHVR